MESKPKKKVCLKKAYFWGHPVIQAVEAKIIGPFYKNSYIYKILFPEKISFFYLLRAEIIRGVLLFGKRPGSLWVNSHPKPLNTTSTTSLVLIGDSVNILSFQGSSKHYNLFFVIFKYILSSNDNWDIFKNVVKFNILLITPVVNILWLTRALSCGARPS